MRRIFPAFADARVRCDPRPDAELLARFLAAGDGDAFAGLVARHGPAVRAVCRGWVRAADVDDAAQATFLVLARRAGTIRDGAALPKWLYRVAGSVARRMRGRAPAAGPLPADLPARFEPPADDGAAVLAEEVARLPEKYRLPVQLCYAAGLTAAVAAGRLGVPRSTVLTRLARARTILRRRLTARGVGPAVLVTAAAVGPAPAGWAAATARAAVGLAAGATWVNVGVSERTVSTCTEVLRAMTWNKLKLAAAAALAATAAMFFAAGRWAAADGTRAPLPAADPPAVARGPAKDAAPDEPAKPAAQPDPAKPPAAGPRREAVIRMPAGTFVKEVDVPPYGTGRLTWTFDGDRVLGQVELSVMGVEVDLETEAEVSLSRTGTIYGIVTSARVTHLRVTGELFGELKPVIDALPAAEPLLTELLTDLPFSYQFRLVGDRLVIQNYRLLLAGPNPLGKAGGVALGEVGVVLGGFQAIGLAVEGTYQPADGKGKDAPKKGRSTKLKRAAVRPPADDQ